MVHWLFKGRHFERRGVRYYWKRDGYLRVENDGSCRFLSQIECIQLMLGRAP